MNLFGGETFEFGEDLVEVQKAIVFQAGLFTNAVRLIGAATVADWAIRRFACRFLVFKTLCITL